MLPLRLVLDTNIVISAALRPDGLQRTVFLLATTKPAKLYVSQPVLTEYRDVICRPELRIRRGLQRQFLDLIVRKSHLVMPRKHLRVTIDPDDNIFLECADAAGADYLVTGNSKHFPKFWKKTKVITSREFMELVAPHLLS
ncbi:MAG TPA: putative toxin-antitoxin system toxin component, PIN family [Bryobacteraceae bacterium]|nr:putative toxin-antitoxin system toxin component, PIN family [Bryobacteraceae bacterium]